jgi:5-methyltetrahydropteroyltriglutamate--homocysteine methyltransferase
MPGSSKVHVFHAETVGSLPHSDELIKARSDFDNKAITQEQLRKIEDEEVRKAVALQERLGFEAVTDGELRRNTYMDFLTDGMTGVRVEWGIQAGVAGYRNLQGGNTATPRPIFKVFDRIRHSPSSAGPRDFEFLKSVTKHVGKATLVGPAFIHFFGGRDAISRDVYPSLDGFWSDLVAAYHQELQQLGAAGCSYVQIDETSLIKMVDPTIRDSLAARGDDPDAVVEKYFEALIAVVAGAPKGMRLSVHLCRGNNHGRWQAQGGYDTVAKKLFKQVNADVFSLEFDSPRAGGFEPLKELPEGKAAILGLLSTKVRTVEDADQIISRIHEASKFAPLECLGVSPQCGFWGGMNLCTPAETEAKLSRVIEIAKRVWH